MRTRPPQEGKAAAQIKEQRKPHTYRHIRWTQHPPMKRFDDIQLLPPCFLVCSCVSLISENWFAHLHPFINQSTPPDSLASHRNPRDSSSNQWIRLCRWISQNTRTVTMHFPVLFRRIQLKKKARFCYKKWATLLWLSKSRLKWRRKEVCQGWFKLFHRFPF